MRRETLQKLVEAQRKGLAVVRALDIESGEEQLLDPAEPSPLGNAAAAAIRTDTSTQVTVAGRSFLLTVYGARWEIVIVGAVHIAQALAPLALAAGYRVRVIDPRAAYATKERFPGIMLDTRWPDEALKSEPLGPRSAIVVLAHDTKLDDNALKSALRSAAFYVGALGSMRSNERRVARLRDAGFSTAEVARIHGPVGLNIGARSPSEIAVAILAEIVQQRHQPMPRIAGIVLAAGKSSRMGHNKLVAMVKRKPMVCHAAEAACAAGLNPVIVVTGHDARSVENALQGMPLRFAHNAAFADGLSASLRVGIEAVPEDCAGAMVLLGDMPGVDSDLIARVRAAFSPADGRTICVATANGKRGHPVLWARRYFAEILTLRGDHGARTLMAEHPGAICEIETDDDAPLFDIDTPQILETHTG